MIDRDKLIVDFAQRIIEGMDIDALVAYALENLTQSFDDYTDEDLIAEIQWAYPDLLEDEE